jgi:hypothetical protein
MSESPTNRPPKGPVRAERFLLHLPARIRMVQSPPWFEGMTENISESGVLFHTEKPFAIKTEVEMRLGLPVVIRDEAPGEIVCLGTIVRMEPSRTPGTLPGLAVAIKGYRIARGDGSTSWSLQKFLTRRPH